MRSVMPPFFRPRLLLLPLLLGVLVAPALLTPSTAPNVEGDLHVGTVCKNVVTPTRKLETPREGPRCANCRAPLLNAPLAQAERAPALPPVVALPPAA